MEPEALVALFQWTDGLFPAGGYAHSLGLETCHQDGRLRDRDDLVALLGAHLAGAAGPCDAAAAVATRRAAAAGDLAACLDLDRTLDAMKAAEELRAASRQMGRQALRVTEALTGDPRASALRASVDAGETPGHHPVVFGLSGAILGWDDGATAAAYLHATAALLVGAAVRLVPLGQLDGQRALAAVRPLIARLAAAAAGATGPADLWAFAPGLEVAAMRHATLDARLFRS